MRFRSGLTDSGTGMLRRLRMLCRWAAPALMTGIPPAGAAPYISEFLAQNSGGLRDSYHESPDWIEIANPGPESVDLTGWHLTDDAADFRKWTFPEITLQAGGYLVVFASGRDVVLPEGELHANFRLSASGGYLALTDPEGEPVSQFNGYPPQRANVSFGEARILEPEPLVGPGSPVRVLIPSSASGEGTWTGAEDHEPFDDSQWVAATNGVGFDRGAGRSPELIAWWDFDDPSDPASVPDRSGNGWHGTVRAAQYLNAGRSGEPGDASMDFRPSGSRVSIPGAAGGAMFADATARDELTISLWVFGHSAQGATAQSSVFWAGSNPDGTGERMLNAHIPWTDQVIYFDTAGCCDPSATRLLVSDPVPAHWRGQWNHYALVKRGPQKEIYRNGERIASGVNPVPLSTIRSFWIGDGSGPYAGLIDDVAIWSRALDPDRISSLASGVSPAELWSLQRWIAHDIGDAMAGVQSSAWMRFPFHLEEEPAASRLLLQVQCDDGFVAWLNGTPIAGWNADGQPAWNASALRELSAGEEATVLEFDLSGFSGLLRKGANILAMQGLNAAAEDPDFLVRPVLRAGTSLPNRYFSVPTPGAPNDAAAYTGFAGEVVCDPPRGYYDAPVEVTLTCPTPDATIVYTTDGSVPTMTHGNQGKSPVTLTISTTTCLRAAAFQGTLAPSRVETHTYLFVDAVAGQQRPPVELTGETWPDGEPLDFAMDSRVIDGAEPGYSLRDSLRSLPALSIVLPPEDLFGRSGLYANPAGRGDAWEREASAENLHADGTPGFVVSFGLRMHGNISRQKSFTPKHSFRMRFRGEYGATVLQAPGLFPGPVTEFDQLVLRAGSTDTWPVVEWGPLDLDNRTGAGDPDGVEEYRWRRSQASYIRDQWVRDTQIAMGHTSARGRYVHLYLNGWYWGLYNICEHPDAAFAASHLGGRDHEYDAIADFSEVKSGSGEAWNRLQSFASAVLNQEANYQRLLGRNAAGERDPALPVLLHEESLIDYMILHIFIGADDWPDHNWWALRRDPLRAADPAADSDGFRFVAWDQEISNVNADYRKSSWGVLYERASAAGTPAYVYSRARLNAGFRRRFGDRIHRHLFGRGALSPAACLARWNALAAEVDRALVAESARWGDYRRPGRPYRREVEWLQHLAWMEQNYWPRIHDAALVRFRSAQLYPVVNAPDFPEPPKPSGDRWMVAIRDTNSPDDGATVYFTTDGSDPADSPTAAVYSGPVPVIPPAIVKTRAYGGAVQGWSALSELSVSVDSDSDGDGIPDAVEVATDHDPADLGDAATDRDGDGFSALEEYLLGTDPLDARDRFEAALVRAGESLVLTFRAVPGRRYAAEMSHNLVSWEELDVLPPVREPGPVHVPVSPAGGRFVRLKVRPE